MQVHPHRLRCTHHHPLMSEGLHHSCLKALQNTCAATTMSMSEPVLCFLVIWWTLSVNSGKECSTPIDHPSAVLDHQGPVANLFSSHPLPQTIAAARKQPEGLILRRGVPERGTHNLGKDTHTPLSSISAERQLSRLHGVHSAACHGCCHSLTCAGVAHTPKSGSCAPLPGCVCASHPQSARLLTWDTHSQEA